MKILPTVSLSACLHRRIVWHILFVGSQICLDCNTELGAVPERLK